MTLSRLSLLLLLAVATLADRPVLAADERPVPRFASLRDPKVNVRSGPGSRYPIEWEYRRQSMPVEILEEHENWRHIRDHEGSVGWVHLSMLSGRRTVMVMGAVRALRERADSTSPLVAQVEPGVIGTVLECSEWCRLDIQGRRGWMLRSDVWGLYPNERVK